MGDGNGNGVSVRVITWRDVAMAFAGVVLGGAGWFFQVYPLDVRSTDLTDIRVEMRAGNDKTNRKLDAVSAQLSAIDRRVSRIEGRIGLSSRGDGD